MPVRAREGDTRADALEVENADHVGLMGKRCLAAMSVCSCGAGCRVIPKKMRSAIGGAVRKSKPNYFS